jgi:penicillin amidase
VNSHCSRIRLALLILLIAVLACGCVSLLVERGWPRTAGTLTRLPLSAPVTIRRDAFGIPHISAGNEKDLFFAQGYVHAQDRFFQMEMVRRLVSGTLSEVLGRLALDMDHFARLAGFPELCRRIAADLSGPERELLASYTAGINSFLAAENRELPLECRLLRLRPRPWTVEDALSNFVLFSWGLAVNYAQELFALRIGKDLPLEALNELFPGSPGAALPPDRYFEDLRQLDTGRLLPAARTFLVPSTPPGGGSNAWAVAAGADGRPLLANDPHLAVSVPQLWYFCHLRAPGLNAAGASVAGTPGILIGRTPGLAWGLTNVMADYVDLFVVRLDPDDPHRYIVAGQSLAMEEEILTVPLRRRSVERSVWHTRYGPVISRLRRGAEAAVVLKWYGTLPAGRLQDHSPGAVLAINRAQSVDEMMEAAAGVSVLGLNLVAADSSGHIAWQALGAVPLRRGYSGRLPADGSSGAMEWEGFLPAKAMPRLVDPPAGRLASANQRLPAVEGVDLSYSWCSPYRYRRIVSVLSGLQAPAAMEDFRQLQLDVRSLQAERLLPRILSFDYQDPKAREAAALLAGWDRSVRADSGAAALWELFVTAWLRLLVEDDLGANTTAYLDLSSVHHSLQDEILARPSSPFWDRRNTRRQETPRDILELALARAFEELEERLGPRAPAWQWGALHSRAYEHPGSALGLLTRRLNRGTYPADGDNETVRATGFLPGRDDYKVLWHSSMRMVAAPGESFLLIMGPMGQSGQPGHRHYDDMIGPWQRGELLRLGLEENAPGEDTTTELILTP